MYIYIHTHIDQALQRTEVNPKSITADLGPCLEKVGYLRMGRKRPAPCAPLNHPPARGGAWV